MKRNSSLMFAIISLAIMVTVIIVLITSPEKAPASERNDPEGVRIWEKELMWEHYSGISVILFVSDWCEVCYDTYINLIYLRSKGINLFISKEEKVRKIRDIRIVPTIILLKNGEEVARLEPNVKLEFSEEDLSAFIDNAVEEAESLLDSQKQKIQKD